MSDTCTTFKRMSPYETKLSEDLRQAVREQGFDPDAEVIPSASATPLETDLSEEEFFEHFEDLLTLRGELIANNSGD